MSRYEWMADARCAQVDPDLWTADRPGNTYRDARLVCQRCPVKRECDAHAQHLRNQPDIALHGMWAEQTPRRRGERHEIGEAA
ncbi:WhiB family transcriptional regulator [Streptomyces sp. FxanaA7]|uniref:WhiB family transcriptional regulator n=1 Tax=Streptomyces sp. FxanaA7 TaxID=1265492 RepID=UPI0005ED7B99|nr:WhiB family transcriptional regulator [Streptomyces sp. FxanaA7]